MIALVAVFAAIASVLTIIFVSVGNSIDDKTVAATSAATPLVRDDSRVLDTGPDGAPVLVEFLDFECEVCGAFYPYVEQIREEYAGQITVVTRYFPIPSHQNSMTAAIAVEAAAQQGMFEQMYQKMFQNQKAWGERQDSQATVFRGYAENLGLDMAAYDAAVADPATQARVQQDFDAGTALGVKGTPTFFLNGTMMSIESLDDFRAQIDAALGR
ncbi:disulfide bond formation protein DsbA (plasmid) [Cnuibacter physcomitrellae]|uniref:Disulfide bond formation protein DsbA n=1 Tax=Cnuibacter physcomitrellae TaxID=1619308 RepID=A0A1X9LWZ2_9MICO|nr:disulfide bond formation protein DsbA [Cnuibacter physcomitrellae]